jgi:hypothetical protein
LRVQIPSPAPEIEVQRRNTLLAVVEGKETVERTKAQTGVWGEFLAQQDLLELGIDSARMTTDYGIDLVAFDREAKHAFSVQVKTTSFELKMTERRPDWKVKREKLRQADLFAFALLDTREVWYISRYELEENNLEGKPLLRLYNGEWALTFYRTDAEQKKLDKTRLIESDLNLFKGVNGLKRFLSTVRQERKVIKAKSASSAA